MSGSSEAEFVLVRRRDLERLTTEVMQMKEFLPQIVNSELVESVQRLEAAESALEGKEEDCDHARARLEVCQGEYLKSREENMSLLAQLSSLQEQLLQQADYCTHMGSALCTLLWGVSNREEAVKTILAMEKSSDFFTLASRTVLSFVDSLLQKELEDEDTEERRFVLGFAGTVANVAAMSCGREFLMTACRELMEVWIQLLGKIKLGTCNRLRVLLLMSLYNVSINRSGLLWLSQKKEFLCDVRRLLTDPDPEVCLNTLRLFQSVLLDPDVLHLLWGEAQQCLPLLTKLSNSHCKELQRMANELLKEIGGLKVEG
ncbi:heat shock factor 2-binding protein [Hyperolius riggenbachi]|uniref:heat shock factor 2-binding protein n=1 Tax=Hyperolius riggenbachi TaxID=752182 RepID=UPI0035A27494